MVSAQVTSSPRIDSLVQGLERGHSGALEAFWQDVYREGTPLVEMIPDEEEAVLVTFLWQGSETTKNVVVRMDDLLWTSLGGAPGVGENAMTNVTGTDVWYKSYRLRPDYCLDYLLSANDPELLGAQTDPWPEHWRNITATWQLDPLNPRQIRIAFEEEDHPEREEWLAGSTWMKVYNSYLELPGFDPHPWFEERPEVRKGRVEKHHFISSVLDNGRAIYTYIPPGLHSSDRPVGLVVLFDAWIYHRVIPTPVILDNLLAEGRIPPVVAVLIDQPDLRDRREMVRNPPFREFLTQEVLPWVRTNYNVTQDPSQTIVGGSSLGGLAAGIAALQNPDIFGKVIMQSGAFTHHPEFGNAIPEGQETEWLVGRYLDSPPLPIEFTMDVGEFDELLLCNRKMRDILLTKGNVVHYQEFYGGHNILCWRNTLADHFMALIGG